MIRTHRHLYLPGSDVPRDGTAPAQRTLLLLHGTGGTEEDLVPLGRTAAPGWGLLSPRGNVLEAGMPRFFRRIRPGVFDLEDIRRRASDLDGWLDAAAERYGLERGRVVALGYSNGANIAAAMMLLRPGSLAGAVLLRACVPIEPGPGRSAADVLILSGSRDGMTPAGDDERLAAMLRAGGARVRVARQDAGHELTQADVAEAARWLAAWGVGDADVSPGTRP